MTNQHGRRYEHTLSRGLDEITNDDVWVTTVGYSGNASIDGSDIVVTVNPELATRGESIQYNIEAKKRQGDSGKRISNAFTGSEKDETGVEELRRFVRSTPSWSVPIVALKMSRRKVVVLDARWLLYFIGERKHPIPPESAQEILSLLQPRVTASGNISVVKPTPDEWPSSSAASADEVVVADMLDLPYEPYYD